jgi:hypothetical protein
MDISSIVNDNSSAPQKDNSNGSNPDPAALLTAIDSANLDRVRTVLREICTANPQAFQLACDKLLVGYEHTNSAQPEVNSPSGAKRKRDPP